MDLGLTLRADLEIKDKMAFEVDEKGGFSDCVLWKTRGGAHIN